MVWSLSVCSVASVMTCEKKKRRRHKQIEHRWSTAFRVQRTTTTQIHHNLNNGILMTVPTNTSAPNPPRELMHWKQSSRTPFAPHHPNLSLNEMYYFWCFHQFLWSFFPSILSRVCFVKTSIDQKPQFMALAEFRKRSKVPRISDGRRGGRGWL